MHASLPRSHRVISPCRCSNKYGINALVGGVSRRPLHSILHRSIQSFHASDRVTRQSGHLAAWRRTILRHRAITAFLYPEERPTNNLHPASYFIIQQQDCGMSIVLREKVAGHIGIVVVGVLLSQQSIQPRSSAPAF